jgi:bacterioferritin-associated ferredoxin
VVARVYVCSCFGITEEQVEQHADDGRCTPRGIASACRAGTDCGSCVKRIQGLLGRGARRPSGAGAERPAAASTPGGPAGGVLGMSAEQDAPGAPGAPGAPRPARGIPGAEAA